MWRSPPTTWCPTATAASPAQGRVHRPHRLRQQVSPPWGTTRPTTSKYTIQLGEELYDGDLELRSSTADVFGRPATAWRYDNKNIGTYANEADVTYTAEVELGDIYKDMDLDSKTVADYMVDGADKGTLTLTRTASEKIGGNGVVIEAYLDDDDNVTIVETNVYVAEVATVDEDDDDEPYITLAALTGPAKNQHYETSAFDEEDIVLYTFADDEIQSVVLAEKVTGNVDKVNSSKNTFDIDGTTYKRSENYATSDNDINANHVGEDVVFYVDTYGFVMYVDEATASDDYAYVIDLGDDGVFDDSKTYVAKLLLTDGTVIEVETDKDYRKSTSLKGYIVSYTEDDGEYSLKGVSTKALAKVDTKLDINSGVASMSINDVKVYANS